LPSPSISPASPSPSVPHASGSRRPVPLDPRPRRVAREAKATIRFSFGAENHSVEIEAVVGALARITGKFDLDQEAGRVRECRKILREETDVIVACSSCSARVPVRRIPFRGKPSKKIRCTKCETIFDIANRRSRLCASAYPDRQSASGRAQRGDVCATS
jgi:hypothetical protein